MCVISGSLGSCSRPLALWTLHSLQSWNLDAPTLAKALVSWWVIPFHDISLEPTPVEWAWNMSWGGACLPGMAWGALHVYFPSRGDHLHPFPLPPKCPDTETFQHAVFFWQGYTFFLKKLLATELVTWLEFLKICFFPFSWMLLPDATSIFLARGGGWNPCSEHCLVGEPALLTSLEFSTTPGGSHTSFKLLLLHLMISALVSAVPWFLCSTDLLPPSLTICWWSTCLLLPSTCAHTRHRAGNQTLFLDSGSLDAHSAQLGQALSPFCQFFFWCSAFLSSSLLS